MASASDTTEDENYKVLIAHYGIMWLEKIRPDITLKTKSQEYPAHKCVLSARSPVFANKLSNHTGDCLDILDVHDDTVIFMLRYIYTGFVGGFYWESALGMYTVAAYYELHDLKNVCSSYLRKHITLDNADTLRTVASIYDDEDLKAFAQVYISKNGPSLKNRLRDAWKVLKHGSPDKKQSSDPTISSINEEQSLAIKNTLIGDFKRMMDRGICSDIKLKTNGGEYPAHKCVLMARSPVFKTSLSNDSSGTLDIGDMDSDTVGRMLLYLYTGQVEKLEMASSVTLYVAAGKYGFGLPIVKRLCLSYLTEHLGPSNVNETLHLLELHPDENLKDFVFALIRANIDNYSKDTLGLLVLEVLKEMANDSDSDSDSDSD